MTDVIGEIINERKRQDEKWGEQNHHPFMWLSILMEEVGEVSKAALHVIEKGKSYRDYRAELIQTAAVAVAMIESFDRGKWKERER